MNNRAPALRGGPWPELGARWILGLVFVYASFHKIAAPADFAKVVYGFGLFPAASINLIAIFLPFLELVAGAALLAGVWPRAAAAVVGGLLVFFSAAVGINLARGHTFDCGCFGFDASPGVLDSPPAILIRNAALLVAAGVVVRPWPHRRACWAGC